MVANGQIDKDVTARIKDAKLLEQIKIAKEKAEKVRREIEEKKA